MRPAVIFSSTSLPLSRPEKLLLNREDSSQEATENAEMKLRPSPLRSLGLLPSMASSLSISEICDKTEFCLDGKLSWPFDLCVPSIMKPLPSLKPPIPLIMP